jgi:hypothetical protein
MLPEPLTRHLTDEELLLDFYDEGTAVTCGHTWRNARSAGHSIRSCVPC